MSVQRKSEAEGRLPLRFEGGENGMVGNVKGFSLECLCIGRNTEYGLQLLLVGKGGGQQSTGIDPFAE